MSGHSRRMAMWIVYGVFALVALGYLAYRPLGIRASERDGGGAVSGRDVFAANCAACHGYQGSGGVGPRLSGLTLRSQFPEAGDQSDFLRSGSAPEQRYGVYGNGTGGMPSFRHILTPQEIEAVVAYTRGLR